MATYVPGKPEDGAVVRALIVSEFVTLDGVMEAPGGEPPHPHAGWVFDFVSEEQEQYKLEEVREAGALLRPGATVSTRSSC
jgi:hypothetical protein